MYTAYVDTSLLAKVIVSEPETTMVKEWIADGRIQLVSSRLLETEMRRVAAAFGIPQMRATEALAAINLVDVPRDAFYGAGIHPEKSLRSLDALHVTMATMVGANAIATYDAKMAAAANAVGLAVITPEQS